MNILQVTPFLTPHRGGSVVILYNLCKKLALKGHEITIITSDFEFDAEYAKALEALNIEVIPFNCKFNMKLFLYTPDLKEFLESRIKEFDLVHLHNYRSYQNNLTCKYANRFGIPLILQAHGSILRIIEKKGFKRIYDFLWGNKILNSAKFLIAVSNIEVAQYNQLGIYKNIKLIPNGIDIEKFHDLPDFGDFRKEYNFKKNSKLIIYVGRMHRIKGLDFLLKTFFKLNKEINNIHLAIIGPDEKYKKTLIDLAGKLGIRKKIKFIEYVNPINAYVDADLVVYPSVYEIFGLVPFEALLSETPVIVTDNCGCTELLKEYVSIVKFGDISTFKDKMIDILINSPEDAKKIAKEGRNFIIENYSFDKIIPQYEKVYKQSLFEQ